MQGGVNIKESWKWEQYIQTNEHLGSLIKLISRWFSQWAFRKRLWILRNILLIAALPPVEIAILLWKSFIDLSLHEPPLRVFSSCFSFLGMPFFLFFIFYCFTVRLKTWTLFKMNEIFISLRKKNSLARVPALDPNGLSKYVMWIRFRFIQEEDK